MIAFRIRQGNKTLEKFDGANAEQEIIEAALVHRHTGELTIQHNAEGHWKRFALFCHWPPSS